jgi:hypothetical protein
MYYTKNNKKSTWFFKLKIKIAVMQEKYGVNHPLQNAQIRDKMKATVIARHGVENVAQLKSTQKKINELNGDTAGPIGRKRDTRALMI